MEARMEERIVVADPVADPQGYQRELLGLLEGQDPVVVLAATPLAVREQASGLSEDLLGRRPQPREWSVSELLGQPKSDEVLAKDSLDHERTPVYGAEALE